jgi:WXG100 family type VII secretion target
MKLMSSDVIQANYEALERIAARFGKEAEQVGEVNGRIHQVVQLLEQGGWEGQGASAFFAEMDGTLYPALQRLINTLEEAWSATLVIKQIIQEAEEEAPRPLAAGPERAARRSLLPPFYTACFSSPGSSWPACYC